MNINHLLEANAITDAVKFNHARDIAEEALRKLFSSSTPTTIESIFETPYVWNEKEHKIQFLIKREHKEHRLGYFTNKGMDKEKNGFFPIVRIFVDSHKLLSTLKEINIKEFKGLDSAQKTNFGKEEYSLYKKQLFSTLVHEITHSDTDLKMREKYDTQVASGKHPHRPYPTTVSSLKYIENHIENISSHDKDLLQQASSLEGKNGYVAFLKKHVNEIESKELRSELLNQLRFEEGGKKFKAKREKQRLEKQKSDYPYEDYVNEPKETQSFFAELDTIIKEYINDLQERIEDGKMSQKDFNNVLATYSDFKETLKHKINYSIPGDSLRYLNDKNTKKFLSRFYGVWKYLKDLYLTKKEA